MKITHQTLVIAIISSLIKNKTHIFKKNENYIYMSIHNYIYIYIHIPVVLVASGGCPVSHSHSFPCLTISHICLYSQSESTGKWQTALLYLWISDSQWLYQTSYKQPKRKWRSCGTMRIFIENTEVVPWVSVWTPLPGFTSKYWLPCRGTDPREMGWKKNKSCEVHTVKGTCCVNLGLFLLVPWEQLFLNDS